MSFLIQFRFSLQCKHFNSAVADIRSVKINYCYYYLFSEHPHLKQESLKLMGAVVLHEDSSGQGMFYLG